MRLEQEMSAPQRSLHVLLFANRRLTTWLIVDSKNALLIRPFRHRSLNFGMNWLLFLMYISLFATFAAVGECSRIMSRLMKRLVEINE